MRGQGKGPRGALLLTNRSRNKSCNRTYTRSHYRRCNRNYRRICSTRVAPGVKTRDETEASTPSHRPRSLLLSQLRVCFSTPPTPLPFTQFSQPSSPFSLFSHPSLSLPLSISCAHPLLHAPDDRVHRLRCQAAPVLCQTRQHRARSPKHHAPPPSSPAAAATRGEAATWS